MRGAAGSQPGIANQPTESSDSTTTPPPYPEDADLPEPGTYRRVVGVDATSGAPVEADLTFEDPGWCFGGQPVISADDDLSSAGIGVFEARALPASSGCLAGETANAAFRQAATTPDALGQQLTKLPRSAVVQALTSTVAFNYDGFHLRLRIDAESPPGEAYDAHAPGALVDRATRVRDSISFVPREPTS